MEDIFGPEGEKGSKLEVSEDKGGREYEVLTDRVAPRVSMVSEEKRKASRPTSVCQVLGQGTVFCRKNSRSKPSRAERKWAIAADEPDSNNAKSAESSEGKEGDAAGTGVAGQELCLVRTQA